MDTSTDQYKSTASQSGSFSAALKTVKGFFRWLLELITLTDEERTKAGIYHGRDGRD